MTNIVEVSWGLIHRGDIEIPNNLQIKAKVDDDEAVRSFIADLEGRYWNTRRTLRNSRLAEIISEMDASFRKSCKSFLIRKADRMNKKGFKLDDLEQKILEAMSK